MRKVIRTGDCSVSLASDRACSINSSTSRAFSATSMARGVGVMPWLVRTSKGSWKTSRRRESMTLIAG